MEKIKVAKCYCDIPREVLGYLAREHFVNHVPTQDLMQKVPTGEWHEWVAIVALLDVPTTELKPTHTGRCPKGHFGTLSQMAKKGKIMARLTKILTRSDFQRALLVG